MYKATKTRFKEASTVVNKRHQEHFEGLKAREEENLQKKTELCEKVEAIATEGLKTFADWDNTTKQVLEIHKDIERIMKYINERPRKKLNFHTPIEVFLKQII